jgi:type III secretion protein U
MSDEKPLPASDKRIQDERKKGNVAGSRDVVSLVILSTIFELLFVGVSDFLSRMTQLIQLSIASLDQPFTITAERLGGYALQLFFGCAGIVLGVTLLAGLAATWATVGFVFAPEALKEGIKKLNPGRYLQNLFSSATLMQLSIGILTMLSVASVSYQVVKQALASLPMLATATLPFAGAALLTLLKVLVHWVLGSLCGFALFDLWLKRMMHKKHLRMDHREMKQEVKESMGDPEIKRAFRQRMTRAAQQPIRSGGMQANAVVSNPEHYAVSLYYERGKVPLPLVIEKGVDQQAQMIMARARAAGIPVIRFRPLARLLHARGGLYDPIPRASFKAVALLYRVVEELRAGTLVASGTLEIDPALWDGEQTDEV